jgi:death on curing protein
VDRPRQSAFGEDAYKTIWLKAAALCQSLDHNQALVDGNKRIAWIFTKTFLRINGHVLGATDHEAETFMLHMVAAGGSLEDIGEWLEVHTSEAELPGGDADFAH